MVELSGPLRRALVQKLESLHHSGVQEIPRPSPVTPAEPASTATPDTAAATRNRPRDVRSAEPPTLFVRDDNMSSPAISAEQRPTALNILAQEVAACTQCRELAETRTQTVFASICSPPFPNSRPDDPMKRERLLWPLVLLGAALLTLACFHQVLTYGFTDKDTLMHITEARVESLGDLGALPFKELTGGRAARDANFYRPTVMLMYAGLRAAFGWEPLGYHAFDLALHSLNGLLLALFAANCARRAGLARPRGFGVLCAGIFVIHPLGVETVPAIARNGDLLVTAFFLAALLTLDRVQRALTRGESWRSRQMLARLAAFTGLYALTLGSKEPGIVLLGAAFLYVALVGRDGNARRRVLRAGLLVLPCLGVTAGYLAVRMRVMASGFRSNSHAAAAWAVWTESHASEPPGRRSGPQQ